MSHLTHAEMVEVINETMDAVSKLFNVKGGEYHKSDDALANFRRNGRDLELPMETIWRVYAGKHWDAVTQYIVDVQNGKSRERAEPIEGRVDDIIVYLCMLKGMLKERQREGSNG